jgi:hypothetical protein
MSVRPSVRMYQRGPAGRISMKSHIGEFKKKICAGTANLVKMEQKYRSLCMNTELRFVVSGDIKSSHHRVKCCNTVRVAEVVCTLTRTRRSVTLCVRTLPDVLQILYVVRQEKLAE